MGEKWGMENFIVAQNIQNKVCINLYMLKILRIHIKVI